MLQRKQVKCYKCGSMTSLYRLEYGENKEKRYSCSKHPKKEVEVKLEGIADKDEKFFEYVWKNSDHHCAECGVEIKEFSRDYVHHVLAKARYKYFRWDIRNTIILCGRFGCHGKAESAISYPKMKIYAYCESLKRELLESIDMVYDPKK